MHTHTCTYICICTHTLRKYLLYRDRFFLSYIHRAQVTRRSQENDDGVRRLETSEFFEQIFDDPNSLQPRIKASQCFTKYIYRSAAEAKGGPEIVATQTVGDFLSAYDTQTMSNMQVVQNLNKPITIYVYRMSFQRQQA